MSDTNDAPSPALTAAAGPGLGDVDPATVEQFTINATRALEEPPIGASNGGPAPDSPLWNAVTRARLQQLQVVPGDVRVTMATWPEVAYFYATATGSNQNFTGGDHTDWYSYAVEVTLRRYFDVDVAAVMDDLGVSRVSLADHQRRELGQFRREYKRQRDRVFLEQRYPGLETDLPKSTWEAGQVTGRVEDVPAAAAADAPLTPRADALTPRGVDP